MLKSIEFHYNIIDDLRKHYIKLYPIIESYYNNETSFIIRTGYNSTKYSEVFGCVVQCNIFTDHHSARLYFKFGDSKLLSFCNISTHPVQNHLCSGFNNGHLLSIPYAEEPYKFSLYSEPNKTINFLHKNDPDELEVMEFMLMTQYNMNDLTAILLHQVFVNENEGIEGYYININDMEKLSTEQKKELSDLYFSTALGLEDEARKVG